MAKLSIVKGTTSKLVNVFIQDSSSTAGAGLTGLAFNTGGLTAYYYCEAAGSSVAISLATMTLGTWATGGFVVVDGTNMPGVYQLSVPNAALASAKSVVIMLKGASNMAPTLVEIELTGTNNQDSIAGGMTALPQAAATTAGGLPTVGTGASQIALDGSGRVTYAPGEMAVRRNVPLNNFQFLMVTSSDHYTPVAGLTVTSVKSLDGGAFSPCSNVAASLAAGIYTINLSAADLNATVVTYLFTAVGADARYITILTQA